ncbi:DNA helicase [Tanacetum coccineum]|uniref:DNA helicase n=1 Tax=Tanacetum coccineum TaxID=301880 RepID=A0ABQ5HNW7_9ASTR
MKTKRKLIRASVGVGGCPLLVEDNVVTKGCGVSAIPFDASSARLTVSTPCFRHEVRAQLDGSSSDRCSSDLKCNVVDLDGGEANVPLKKTYVRSLSSSPCIVQQPLAALGVSPISPYVGHLNRVSPVGTSVGRSKRNANSQDDGDNVFDIGPSVFLKRPRIRKLNSLSERVVLTNLVNGNTSSVPIDEHHDDAYHGLYIGPARIPVPDEGFSTTSCVTEKPLGAHVDDSVSNGRGPYVFKISGQLYHWIGSLCPPEGQPPRFLQLYIYDTDNEVDNRMSHFGGDNSDLRRNIDTHAPNFKVRLYNVVGAREYELPTGDMLGAIVYEIGPETDMDYDIVLEERLGYPKRVHDRANSYNYLSRTGRLFQQYVVTAFYAIEQNRIDFVREHQSDIRNEYLSGICDAINRGDSDGSDCGLTLILPQSFTGGPRYMYNHYLDALAICRVHGNPSFFITFTCNVKWPEISEYMAQFPLLTTTDRAYVSNSKSEDYLTVTLCYGYMNRIVSEFMMHGPCRLACQSASCMQNSPRCKKGFPKEYCQRTYIDKNGFVHYKRMNTDVTTTRQNFKLDNSYVVPYNKKLLTTFYAHINVEYCGWSMLIKYLFKYISKGTDRVVARISRNCIDASTTRASTSVDRPRVVVDEIKNYLDARYISPHEACWRIFEFNIHYREPAVQILSIHLMNMQRVVFRERDRLDSVVLDTHKKKTTLREWLHYNEWNTDSRHLTYLDFPSEFVWYADGKYWRRRRIRTKSSIGRLTYVHPIAGDLFYQRMLLWHQKGCRSFLGIRTVNDVVYLTCRVACEALGLLENDREWEMTLEEAALTATPT